jgi:hypothetical protein
MREKLKAIEGRRARYRAVFECFHSRTSFGYEVKSLILRDVTDAAGNPVCDHLWFRRGKQFDELQLQPGDRVEFEARAGSYLKGYGPPEEKRLDYCLKNPTKVKRLAVPNAMTADLPLFAHAGI